MNTPDGPNDSRSLWDHCATDWTAFQEPRMHQLYEIVLKALGPINGTQLLDVGCASGIFCEMAALAGSNPTGFDLSPKFLEFAKARLPKVNFTPGSMETMPFPDECFDIVTCLNSIYYSVSPIRMLKEARRVLKPGGRLVLSTWAKNDDCDAAHVLASFRALSAPSARHLNNPFSFSISGIFQALTAKAGFRCSLRAEASIIWNYNDEETAIRALLACDQGQRAIDHSGTLHVSEALRAAITPFQTPQGGFRLRNKIKSLVATKIQQEPVHQPVEVGNT